MALPRSPIVFDPQQKPLTYVQAPTPSGGESTLEVRVNGVKWHGVPSLYNEVPAARVYTTLNQADGRSEVLFGDGIEGSLLPTGQSNIQASYRSGSGSAGNVGAGALTSLIDRPLGVSSVTNPEAAAGGQDPEQVSDIRVNAPRTVLTLGRAVSITDYENFARSFAGIAKAHALWIQDGPGRGVFLTVAGAGGAALPAGNPTLGKLAAALKTFGNPLFRSTCRHLSRRFSASQPVCISTPIMSRSPSKTKFGRPCLSHSAFLPGISAMPLE